MKTTMLNVIIMHVWVSRWKFIEKYILVSLFHREMAPIVFYITLIDYYRLEINGLARL